MLKSGKNPNCIPAVEEESISGGLPEKNSQLCILDVILITKVSWVQININSDVIREEMTGKPCPSMAGQQTLVFFGCWLYLTVFLTVLRLRCKRSFPLSFPY